MMGANNTVVFENKDLDKKFSHLEDVCKAFKIFASQKIGEKLSILDVGCRSSLLKKFFEEEMGFIWFGVDTNPLDNGVFKADMHCTPFPDELFDIVFCCHTFEHSETPIALLQEMSRVVKAHGVIFLATPAYCDYQVFRCDKTHVFVLTSDQMRRLVEYCGLKFVMCKYIKHEGCDDKFASLITIAEVVR